ncbi:MAG: choice-of-anchor I family protein [Planctomycetales bacterium]|nr:choice-of-anchor I family protein [Planctomycetales bacterium]
MKCSYWLSALVLALVPAQTVMAQGGLYDFLYGRPEMTLRWRHSASGAEIVAHDKRTDQVFVTNLSDQVVDVLSVVDGSVMGTLDVSDLGADAEPTSVAAHNGRIAVAVSLYGDEPRPGVVRFFDARSLDELATVEVGFLPDSVAFSPNGQYLVVCNEGEPSDDYTIDPVGSVSVISVGNMRRPRVRTASFASFDGNEADLRAQGIRIFGPGASASQDFEPEYSTISHDSRFAYVTLQENNAVAKIDLNRAAVVRVYPLGTKDHSVAGNGIDASDRDSMINIDTYPIRGMYMPDSIGSFQIGGFTFLATANEGDSRDYDGYSEETRIGSSSYVLDPTVFPDAAALKNNGILGRLNVTLATGDTDGDGDYDEIHAFGARSFSLWVDTRWGLFQVFDSGDAFEQLIAATMPDVFNVSNDDNNFDSRSDNKGPEPEALAMGWDLGQALAFVGLERQGGVMLYDVSNPFAPRFIEYRNDRDFDEDPETPAALDSGPEGFAFVARGDSPVRKPLLLVANEVTGSTVCYEVRRTGGLLSGLLNR